MKITLTDISRDDALALAASANDEIRDRLVAQIARFEVGDMLAHRDSPQILGTVVDGPTLLGFPEVVDGIGIGYVAEFPGPENVGTEEIEIVENGDIVSEDEAYHLDLENRKRAKAWRDFLGSLVGA